MTMQFRGIANAAAADGAISAEEVLELRRAGWANGAITPDEAEAIFAINDGVAHPTREWTEFFVEALCEFVVNGTEPRGYVDESQASWLIDRVDHDGKLDSLCELELLVKILERATNAPQVLKEFILAQIETAVLTGEGPTRGGSLEPAKVTAAEAALLRRVIFAQAGDRPAAVGRKEAELLFRLKDKTLDADNAPEWKALFVQGVGNYLMTADSYAPLSNERAAELEHFMENATPHLLGFAARMGKADIGSGFRHVFGRKKQPVIDRYAEMREAEAISTQDQTWLHGQIDANDQVDEYDRALRDFLNQR